MGVPVIIWGCGLRGKTFFETIDPSDVVAFIDEKKYGNEPDYCGKKIISFEDYLEDYIKYPVIISATYYDKEIISKLEAYDETLWFNLSDEPSEVFVYGDKSFMSRLPMPPQKEGRYLVFGATWYACYYYNYLKDNGYNNVFLYCNDSSKGQKIHHKLDIDVIFDFDSKSFDEVFIASKDQSDNLTPSASKITNIFEISYLIDDFYNPELEKLKNICEGEKCIIVATGPSLKKEDLERLKGIKSFGVNRVYKMETSWRPDYYVCVDKELFNDDIALNNNSKMKFFPDGFNRENKAKGEVYTFHHVAITTVGDGVPFSKDISKRIFGGSTVVYTCIQIAIYMGFNRIALVGVDFNYSKSKNNHFYAEKVVDDKDHHMDVAYEAFVSAQKYAKENGIRIVNASSKSKLDVFDKVEIEKVLSL